MTRTRSAEPAGGAARRPRRRGDCVRRDVDRRAERSAARHRHRPGDGHRVRHERRARRGQLQRPQARHLSRFAVHAGARQLRRGHGAEIDAEVKRILGGCARRSPAGCCGNDVDVLDELSERLLGQGSRSRPRSSGSCWDRCRRRIPTPCRLRFRRPARSRPSCPASRVKLAPCCGRSFSHSSSRCSSRRRAMPRLQRDRATPPGNASISGTGVFGRDRRASSFPPPSRPRLGHPTTPTRPVPPPPLSIHNRGPPLAPAPPPSPRSPPPPHPPPPSRSPPPPSPSPPPPPP